MRESPLQTRSGPARGSTSSSTLERRTGDDLEDGHVGLDVLADGQRCAAERQLQDPNLLHQGVSGALP